MRLDDARRWLKEVHGRELWWLKEWGLSTVKEAVRTVRSRAGASDADLELAEDVERKIYGY